MNVELINTGSELMLGRVLNTHQQWLCRRLADSGHIVTRQVAVADTGTEIQNAVRESLARADLIIVTGGLGPTSDDITRELIAELLGKKLIRDEAVLAAIKSRFANRNWPMAASNEVQAMVPEGAIVLNNPNGTAPGLAIKIDGAKKWLVMLPGPPRELRPMFDNLVMPLIRQEFPVEQFVCRTLRSTGIGESRLEEMVAGHLQPFVKQGLQIGYCARPGAVDVRLCAYGESGSRIVREAEIIVKKVLGGHVFGFDDDELETVIVRLLTEKKKTLALAESCTGGNIAHRITNVSGSSAVFLGGIVSYANSAKENLLGVRPETLAANGAVSEAVAREMAEGARKRFEADFAIAVTGIAGPDGGTRDKPVGTVYIALAGDFGVQVERKQNAFDRETFKQITAQQAFEMLRVKLI